MHNRYALLAGLALALGSASGFAHAAGTDGVAELRRQLEQLRQDYETHIKALEQRLEHAEQSYREAERTAAAPAPTVAQAPPAPNPPAAANAFNPAIGVILNGTYADLERDPDGYAIPGFALGEETGPGERGLALGESELNVSANIDNLFYGRLTAALTPEGEAEVEEAFIQTLALDHGLTVKAGRFFSGIGYQNAQHAHVWDFVDAPLPYRAMLGNQYGDDGVQVTWLAPTDPFVEFGAEKFRGESFPAGGAADEGLGAWSAYVHFGGDVGISNSWRAGLSHLRTKADERDSEDGADIFTGTSKLTILDGVWKWAPNGNPTVTNLKLQGEYFWRDEEGEFNGNAYDGSQSGWYAQAVYQFMPRWRVGLRHDEVHADDPGAAFDGTVLDNLGYRPRRNSIMVDFSNSEFSRLRLQFNQDKSQPQEDHQWYLQYIMSLGAHGAHAF
jgi:hypothetical protein